jgi:transposase
MERRPKGLYLPEFRVKAAKLVEQAGMSTDRAAKQLSIPKSRLKLGASWKEGAIASGRSRTAASRQPGKIELARLRRELAETKQEHYLLKNATSPKGSSCGALPAKCLSVAPTCRILMTGLRDARRADESDVGYG